MKKLLVTLFSMLLALPALGAQFKEGTHYTVLNTAASDSPQIEEVFSFGCPHCFRFEGPWHQIITKLNSNVKKEKVHAEFLRFAPPEVQADLSKTLLIARSLKMEDKIATAIFNYIHVQKARFGSRDDIRNLAVLNGIDGKKFDQLIDSFAIVSQHMAMQKRVEHLSKLGVNSVPTVIVNGKYRIKGGVSSLDEYVALVNFLLAKKG